MSKCVISPHCRTIRVFNMANRLLAATKTSITIHYHIQLYELCLKQRKYGYD